MKTTLNQIRAKVPCTIGWEKLLRHLGKTQADDEPVSIITILDSNGLRDAIWCLRAVEGHDKEIRLFAVWCARQVQHLMKDKRSIDALDVAERYASGLATRDELEASRKAAYAAYAAANAAADAADAAYAAACAANAAADAANAANAAVHAAYAACAANAAAYAAFAANAAAYAAAYAANDKELCNKIRKAIPYSKYSKAIKS